MTHGFGRVIGAAALLGMASCSGSPVPQPPTPAGANIALTPNPIIPTPDPFTQTPGPVPPGYSSAPLAPRPRQVSAPRPIAAPAPAPVVAPSPSGPGWQPITQ
jgi:hypothetical protein